MASWLTDPNHIAVMGEDPIAQLVVSCYLSYARPEVFESPTQCYQLLERVTNFKSLTESHHRYMQHWSAIVESKEVLLQPLTITSLICSHDCELTLSCQGQHYQFTFNQLSPVAQPNISLQGDFKIKLKGVADVFYAHTGMCYGDNYLRACFADTQVDLFLKPQQST